MGYLEDYIGTVEKIHREQANQYEKALKTISKPLREGHHFDQNLGGIAGFYENLRQNTQALVNTNAETAQSIKGSVLPILERLHKEIKNKVKELANGAIASAKEVEKARNTTQKHIEALGQFTASFESTGGKMVPSEDPYVIHRGVLHRLHKQVIEENNHRNDLISVQQGFADFEAHVITVMQQAMEVFNEFVSGQAEKTRALYADILGAAQRIPPDFEWANFTVRNAHILINPNEPGRSVDMITFANQEHPSTKPLIEGSLERKSRNKLSWGMSTGYYVITPSKYLHEFKDSDNARKDPVPELSIYLPEATVGHFNGDKFSVKAKDRSKTMSSKLTGTSELNFKAHTPADAERWYQIISKIVGATVPSSSAASDSAPASPVTAAESPVMNELHDNNFYKAAEAEGGYGSGHTAEGAAGTNHGFDEQKQESGVIGGAASPTGSKGKEFDFTSGAYGSTSNTTTEHKAPPPASAT